MADTGIESLGPLQRAVMEVLWDRREATVHEVLESLAESKTLAYTSVLSCLQKLEKLGWVDHRAEGRIYIYRPKLSRNDATKSSLMQLIEGVFGGKPTRLFQQLLEDDQLSKKDLDELQKLIDRRRNEGSG